MYKTHNYAYITQAFNFPAKFNLDFDQANHNLYLRIKWCNYPSKNVYLQHSFVLSGFKPCTESKIHLTEF